MSDKNENYVPLVKDDPIANYFVSGYVVNEYYAHALVSFLSSKGIINLDEFNNYLCSYCNEQIKSKKKDYKNKPLY